MMVCANVTADGKVCGREMTCVKTGMDVLVDEHYSYRGDLYECRHCHTRAVKAVENGFHSPIPVVVNQWTVRLNQ